jgi:hypothetical protein
MGYLIINYIKKNIYIYMRICVRMRVRVNRILLLSLNKEK